MHTLLELLRGGDLRSIGQAAQAAEHVLRHPRDVAVLFEGMCSEDAVLRMRCADALEKASAQKPCILLPYKRLLLGDLSVCPQQEVRWHVAPMLVRLPLSLPQQNQVLAILLGYTQDSSSIVKTLAMQALADLALRYPRWADEVQLHIEVLTQTGTPAMQARGRKLLAASKRRSPTTPTPLHH